jgi:DNA-binding LacI/PurR family transcriptional regulator
MSSDAEKISDTADARAAAYLHDLVRKNPGIRLPPERELSESLGVGRSKLRMILRKMQAKELIEARRGSGNYAVDPARRGVRTISLLIDSEIKLGDDPFFSLLFEHLQRAIEGAALGCNVTRIGAEKLTAPVLTDGAITLGSAGREIADIAAFSDVPLVAMMPGGHMRPNKRTSIVLLDDYKAGREAAEILLKLGCDEVVFFGRLAVDAANERHRGAEEECWRAGIGMSLVETSLNYIGGRSASMTLPLTYRRNTGFIAANDWMGVGLRSGLSLNKTVRDPQSLPIVSFDGLPVSSEPSLRITSFRVPIGEIASDTVAEIFRIANSPGSAGRTLLYPLQNPDRIDSGAC